MKHIIYAALGLFAFVSCHEKMEIVSPENNSDDNRIENTHVISMDEALADLEAFMKDSDTKATDNRSVCSVKPIKLNGYHTKGLSDDYTNVPILYVAQFEGEQGFAVLAADDRIEEKILAITDGGSISTQVFDRVISIMKSGRYEFEEYPKSGPAFFTTPETGDELFINPNATSFYDEEQNDTYVGNFLFDDTGAVLEDGSPYLPEKKDSLPDTPELIASYMCLAYACNELDKYIETKSARDHGLVIIDDCPDKAKTQYPIDNPTGSVTRATSYSNWIVAKQVNPILSKYSSWHQWSPFNDLNPRKRKFAFVGPIRKALAGCFPLAISKIMTHFRRPASITYNGYTVDWAELQKTYNSAVGKNSAAALLKLISSGCNSLYFYGGTFTFPGEATSFMRFAGYNNAKSVNYSFGEVTKMTNDGKPLIIYSIPGINIFKSHAWNIDGYKIKERTKTTREYINGKLNKTTNTTEKTNMVHCDFGWSGKCNGYYVSGVFKLNDPGIEYDRSWDTGKSDNYNNYIHLVTYDLN